MPNKFYLRPKHSLVLAGFALLVLASIQGHAQEDKLPCNPVGSTPWVNGTDPGYVVDLDPAPASPGVASWSNPSRAIDSNLGQPAIGSITLGGSVTLTAAISGAGQFEAGHFAGFRIQPSNIAGSTTLRIRTLLNGVEQQSMTSSSFLLDLGGPYDAGFWTTAPFDALEIRYALVGVTGSIDVYYPFVNKFCAGPDLASAPYCNIPTALTAPTFPMITEVGSSLLAGVSNPNNAINGTPGTTATLNVLLGAAELAVKDVKTEYEFPNGAFVGFDIQQADLIDVGLLSGLRVSVYLDDVEVDASQTGGLVSAGLLSSGRQKIGFITKERFNKIKISNASLLSLSSGIAIHNAFIQPFCEGEPLACNTPTAITAPEYPVFVNYKNTSVDGLLAAGSSITGIDNVLDANSSDPAILTQLLGVGSPMSFAVKKGGAKYQGGEYVGFDIESASLLDVGLLQGVSIVTYKDDQVVRVYNSEALALSASLLQLDDRQMIGIVTQESEEFDEVKITFTNLAGLDPLGSIRISRFVAETYCAVPVDCNTEYALVRPAFPAVIESARTGLVSIACALCEVENTANLIDGDFSTHARIRVPVSVGGGAAISVRTPGTVYEAGTFAGFAIRSLGSLIQAELFSSLTIRTYLNGSAQQSASGGDLTNFLLKLNLLSPSSGVFNVGFATTEPFDEIRIEVEALASVLNAIDVYSAFVKTGLLTESGCFTPDLTPDRAIDNTVFTNATPRDFIIDVTEIQDVITLEDPTITVRVSKLSAFDISYITTSGVSDVNGGTNNNNGDWTFDDTDPHFIIITANSTIAASSNSIIGMIAKRKDGIPANTVQNLTITIVAGSGGETNSDNNVTTLKLTAQ